MFVLYYRPCSAHVGYKRTDRSSLTEHNMLGIFYMYYEIDMTTHGMVSDQPVGGTGWSESVTFSQQVNCQQRQNRGKKAVANHNSLDH